MCPQVIAGPTQSVAWKLGDSCQQHHLRLLRESTSLVDRPTTTEIYARASTEAKRKALEATYTEIVTDELPEWNHDTGLLTWLASL